MTNLTELWMNDNFISDVPECIGNLLKMVHFDISCNRLESISNSIGLCLNMTLLLLSMNDLKELPNSIGKLGTLHTLKIDHNLLENLPESIGSLQNLEELDVQFNNLKSFPHSIGMLRKLSSLMAAQNSIAFLPPEFGSCTSLSVLSLHYNNLIYLPEEIGHLQNLTSISLINNKLRYLPITILSLRKLKALWLSHNQIQPLITLQTETLENGQVILTCVFLPQIEVPLEIEPLVAVASTGRKIEFIEPGVNIDLPVKFTRIPTPHPKAFVKYQRTLGNSLKRNTETLSHTSSTNTVYIKEANIIPMKSATNEKSDNEILTQSSLCSIDQNVSETASTQSRSCSQVLENSRELSDTFSKDISIESDLTTNVESTSSTYIGHKICDSMVNTKPKQPPPYHIAAAYSKGAHIFLNSTDKSAKEAEPKHFTQDQPLNILNPQPKHARCIPQHQHKPTCIDQINNENNIEYYIIESVLKVMSKMLRVHTDTYQYKCIVEQYLKMLNSDNPELLDCSFLDLKMCLLQATENLLSQYDYLYYHKDHISRTIEHLEINLTLVDNQPLDLLHISNSDSEANKKLLVIEIVAMLLDTNARLHEYKQLLNGIQTVLQEYHSDGNFAYEFDDKHDTLVLFKLHVIKIVLYFLSCNISKVEYQQLFETIIPIQKKLEAGHATSGEPHQKDISHKNANDSKSYMNWVFGAHRNRKIIKVELTPCCYVLGFSVNHTVEGVFIEDVDKNGNAFQKLFSGDKILMLDDRDISKIDPQEALKAVQVWGPETETFLVSRN